jgi:CheY-like chemotaxis protein
VPVECLLEPDYRIFEASSVEDATRYLNSNETIDVLFTDIQFGGTGDGWDFAEAFRQKCAAPP